MEMKYCVPTQKGIHILGRTCVKDPLPLFWTASGVEFLTDSSEVWFDITTDFSIREEWVRIEVDGFCIQRILLPKGRNRVCAFRGFPKDTVRHIRFMKEVQPMRNDERRFLLLHGIEYDGELYPFPEERLKIEFVGDSLSAGEGLGGSAKLVGAGSAMFGLEGHYALETADYFGADFRILAQSGWGVYSSCHNDLIQIMPKYYEQICGVLMGNKNEELGAFEKQDFCEWQPDVVVVNLGSNDGFALDREAWINPMNGEKVRQITNPYGGVEEKSALRFEGAVIEFLKKLRRCNREAYLLWAYGMCDHTMTPYLQRAVAIYKEECEDSSVDFLSLPSTTELWAGSSHHPGKRTHRYAAEVLIDKIKAVTNKKAPV